MQLHQMRNATTMRG